MQTWTTENLPARDQFSYWREVICEVYVALNPVRYSTGGFSGAVSAHPVSTVNVTTIRSERQNVIRGAAEISKMPREVYFLNFQLEGQCRMSQGGRSTIIKPGEFALVDSTQPYSNDYFTDEWKQYSFRVPRHLLRPLLRHPNESTAVRVADDGAFGMIAIEFLKRTAQKTEALSEVSAATWSSCLVDLVSLAVGGTDYAQQSARKTARHEFGATVIRHIEANAADPALSPAKVATHFHVSTRYLHKILEEQGRSFGRILLERRLERCAMEFAAGRGRVSISEVAFRWGFNDLSHFSRSFRRRFDRSPREFAADMGQLNTPPT
jgi:AraC family transcriptional regulator, positive regulator of tynA and feaB